MNTDGDSMDTFDQRFCDLARQTSMAMLEDMERQRQREEKYGLWLPLGQVALTIMGTLVLIYVAAALL